MKQLLLFSILNILILNIYSLEIKISEFRDPRCAGTPIHINSYSKCSPNKYWRILENATKIVSADINSIDQCRYTKYTKLKFQEYKNGECRLEENFGYSFLYELNLKDDPKPIKNYCNQVKYFDCNNYSIYSFLNNTCELYTSTNYTKQVCIGNQILTYECKTENCLVDSLESDCKLLTNEDSNFNNIKSIQIDNPQCKNSFYDSKEIQIGLQMFQTNTNNSISTYNIQLLLSLLLSLSISILSLSISF